MPISLPNFFQTEARGYGLPENLLETAFKGYEIARKPKQIAQEEQQREFANRLLGHQGTNEEIKSRYLGPEYEANIANKNALTQGYTIENALQREFGREGKQVDIAGKKATNRHQELVNQIAEATGMDAAKADTYLKQQQAKYAHLAHQTQAQKDAQAAGLVPGTKDYQDYMRANIGLFSPPKDKVGNPIPVPAHAISLAGKGLGERGHYETEMRKNIDRGEAAKRANTELKKIIDITKANPKLNRSFSYIASDPELLNPSTWSKAIRGLNENEQTQLDLLVKSTNKLVLAQEDASPGRGSDLRRKLQIASKPGVGMTDAARINIAESTMKENEPLASYADEAAPFVGSYYIPYQAKNYQKENGYEGTGYTEEEVKEAWQLEKTKNPKVTLKDIVNELKALQ